jgi:hypothetical protein
LLGPYRCRNGRLRRGSAGIPTGMMVFDIAGAPFRWGAALRHRRLFHPVGILAHGSLERLAPAGVGLPVESTPIVGRVSKALGLPGSLPDIAGLAFRVPPGPLAATPWDLLLASAGSRLVTRVALRPVTSWSTTWLSTLMPLGYNGEVWWVRARIVSEVGAGLALDTVADRIGRGGLHIDIEQANGAQNFQPLGRLILDEVISTNDPAHDVSFDPTLHGAPGVTLLPGWLADFRRLAYRRSRQGRVRAERTETRTSRHL